MSVSALSREITAVYALPVSELSNAEALAGDRVTFPFDKMEEGTWTGKVTKHDGSTLDIEVPVMRDPESGDVILGDAKRKILCADYARFEYDETVLPRIEGDEGYSSNELLIYDTFIRVWDFFESIGWAGPDGEGTPSILLMDMVDSNGAVIRNACYSGRHFGFQTFAFNREDPDGECYDVVAHEFTHFVTATMLTTMVYVMDVHFFSGESPMAEYLLTDAGWVVNSEDGGVAAKTVTVEEGNTTEVTAQGLGG